MRYSWPWRSRAKCCIHQTSLQSKRTERIGKVIAISSSPIATLKGTSFLSVARKASIKLCPHRALPIRTATITEWPPKKYLKSSEVDRPLRCMVLLGLVLVQLTINLRGESYCNCIGCSCLEYEGNSFFHVSMDCPAFDRRNGQNNNFA